MAKIHALCSILEDQQLLVLLNLSWLQIWLLNNFNLMLQRNLIQSLFIFLFSTAHINYKSFVSGQPDLHILHTRFTERLPLQFCVCVCAPCMMCVKRSKRRVLPTLPCKMCNTSNSLRSVCYFCRVSSQNVFKPCKIVEQFCSASKNGNP